MWKENAQTDGIHQLQDPRAQQTPSKVKEMNHK